MATKVPTAPPTYDDAPTAILATAQPISRTCCCIYQKQSFDEALRARGFRGSEISFNDISNGETRLKIFIAPVTRLTFCGSTIKKSKQQEFQLKPYIEYDKVIFQFWKSHGYLRVRIDGNELKVVLELDKFVRIDDNVRNKRYAICVTETYDGLDDETLNVKRLRLEKEREREKEEKERQKKEKKLTFLCFKKEKEKENSEEEEKRRIIRTRDLFRSASVI